MNQNIPSTLSIQRAASENDTPQNAGVWSSFRQGNNYLISFGSTVYYDPLRFNYIYFASCFYKKLQL